MKTIAILVYWHGDQICRRYFINRASWLQFKIPLAPKMDGRRGEKKRRSAQPIGTGPFCLHGELFGIVGLFSAWEKWKWLAKIFAVPSLAYGLFGIGTFSQVNGISSAVHGFFDSANAHCVNLPFLGEYSWSVVISSLVLAFCVASVLIGGIKRIASVSQVIVPFMAIIYFLFAGILIVTNITAVPSAIAVIVEAAFSRQEQLPVVPLKYVCRYAKRCRPRYFL